MVSESNTTVDEEEAEESTYSTGVKSDSQSSEAGNTYASSSDSDGGDDNEKAFRSNSSSDADEQDRSRLKRRAEHALAPCPFKRRRLTWSSEYLELLNREIDDAAHRVCFDEAKLLPHSQVGLSYWSSPEKRVLFEALARLGRHDLPGLAAQVGSKSLLEVQQYINLLREARDRRKEVDSQWRLEMAGYPAAVELSPQCCYAQEEAADAISLRLEHCESQQERKKWGDIWDINPQIALKLEREQSVIGAKTPAFARFFHLPRWLTLSSRIFMNSAVPISNWQCVENVLPSMWASSFDDLHSLVASVTRRLVQATLFVSMSRIKAKRNLLRVTRNIVWRRDAEAAIASLGMTPNSYDRWRTCARRLRLEVYEDLPVRGKDEECDPMTYDEVEAALRGRRDAARAAQEEVNHEEQQQQISSDNPCDDTTGTSETSETHSEEEEDGGFHVFEEADEILCHTATSLRDIDRLRPTLRNAIVSDRNQETHADLVDSFASYRAELEMWDVLQIKPPMEIPKMSAPEQLEKSRLHVDEIYPPAMDWVDTLQYQSEWEGNAK